MTIDLNFGSVVLLAHMDGVNASTTFVDVKGKTITASGNAQISTAQSKFGGASAYFDGTGDYLNVSAHADFGFSTGAWTAECWFYSTKASWAAAASSLMDFRESTGNGLLYVQTDGVIAYWNDSVNYACTTAMSLNAWHHVAVSYDGTTLKIFVNGVQENSTAAALDFSTARPLRIGATISASDFFQGYIDDLRITKGVARYTATFTPPTEAYPETDVAPASAVLNLTAPAGTITAYGGAYASLTAPAGTVTAHCGGFANLTAPTGVLTFAAHDSYGENALFATAPKPTLLAYTGDSADLTAPSATLEATGTGTGILKAALNAPRPTLNATGTSTTMLSASLAAPSPNLVGYGGAVCSITGPMGTLVATGTTGSIMRASVTVPMAQLTATVTRQGSMSALLTAPSPRMAGTLQAYLIAPGATLTAIGSATITATYEAYALNLNHSTDTNDELTHYTNFPFTHVVRYKNSYYGANSTGLYLLEGTTDDGDPIEWSFKTGMTDLDSPQIKTVTYAYFGGRLGPGATVTIYPSEPTGTSYAYTTPRGQVAQNYRQKFGKGLKARYFAIGASGNDVLESDSIDLTVATLTRRI